MRRRPLSQTLAACSVLLLACSGVSAQDYLVPRLANGQPDFSGVWTNDTITPIERPVALSDRAFLSEDEIASMEQNIAQRRERNDNNIVVEAGGSVGGYNQIWLDSGDTVLSTGQTSMVTDPPNGRAPIRESALATRDFYFANVENDYIYHTVWDRCITRGVPGSMLPAGYNNAYRFLQTDESFTIVYEMIHDVRTISLNKRTHIDDKVKLWMGDSVARWDGDTLEIETTNFNDRGMLANSMAGGRLKGVPISEDFHVLERFTRISADTIIWEARVTDPENLTAPFTISMPLTQDPEYVMYEYACHEGNYAIENILSAGRARDRQQASN